MKPIDILYTIPNFITAGSGREMLNIIERLDRSKFKPTVCVAKKGGALDKEVARLGIDLVEAEFFIPERPFLTLIPRAIKAAQIFKPHRFALWHSFNWSSDFTEPLIAKFAGAKWIYTKKNMNWNRRWHLKSLLADKIAARNTTMMSRFFQSPLYKHKTVLIPGGVDSSKFDPARPKNAIWRKKLGIADDQMVFVSVAQLSPVKGQHVILEALSEIQDGHLLLAGRPIDDDYYSMLKEKASHLNLADRVHFLGAVEDVPGLLAESDIFILATTLHGGHEEGCPVALLEAMAAGKCCIASDVAGSRDLIKSGVNGYLFTLENASSLASTLIRLSRNKDLVIKMGKMARQDVERQFSAGLEAERFKKIYENIK